ncbi:MAG: hypothetical protein ABIV21_08190 [Pyrinomonadaceae bacterium]
MTSKGSAVILALIAFAGSSPSCGKSSSNGVNSTATSSANRAVENANIARTNVEELGVIVNVPYEAEDVVWKEKPDNKRVLAVLRFSPADSNKVVAEAEAFGRAEKVQLSAETWFPDELIAQSDMRGDSVLRGTAYPANRFFQEPFSSGSLIRVEGSDYFILDLTAK